MYEVLKSSHHKTLSHICRHTSHISR